MLLIIGSLCYMHIYTRAVPSPELHLIYFHSVICRCKRIVSSPDPSRGGGRVWWVWAGSLGQWNAIMDEDVLLRVISYGFTDTSITSLTPDPS